MKKLNITKKAFEKSKYFQKKYGKLMYVSESGNMFKTNKGQILMFNESVGGALNSISDIDFVHRGTLLQKWIKSLVKNGKLPDVERYKSSYNRSVESIIFKGMKIYWYYVLQQIGLDSRKNAFWSDESDTFFPSDKLVRKIEDWLVNLSEDKQILIILDALNKVYGKGGIFAKDTNEKLWLGIPKVIDGGETILYGKVEIPKIDVISNLTEDYPELDELDEYEQDDWLQSHKKDVAKMIKEMAWAYRE